MLLIKIKRISYLTDTTLGVLMIEGVPLCMTLEPPWKNNEKRVSCIPVGSYHCERVRSPKFGNTFEVNNVSGRGDILFHIGNVAEDTSGCILLGSEFGEIDGSPAVLNSKNAIQKFFRITKDINEFSLKIES